MSMACWTRRRDACEPSRPPEIVVSEFEIIRRHFRAATPAREDVLLGVGDDCALLQVPSDRLLAVSSDTLVAGRHFEPQVAPDALGHKALAVNLSDLAAMGAEPVWASLCLTLPEADEAWLSGFAKGFTALAQRYGVQLVGGDTTRGPLSVSVTVHGLLEPGRAMQRDRARPGDLLYVTGQLGDAGLALLARQGLYVRDGSMAALQRRLDRPEPRVAEGRSAAALAHAGIDLSDGLGSDLRHLCEASGVGALLYLESLPLSDAVRDYVQETGDWSVPLSSGDDYELLVSVPADRQSAFETAARDWSVPATWVGIVDHGRTVRAMHPDGRLEDEVTGGYDHFRD